MLYIINLLVSVAADIIAYYACKWLDRHQSKGQ